MIKNNKLSAWKIVCEIKCRSRKSLTMRMLHPGDAQYECLALLDRQNGAIILMVNIKGSSILLSQTNELITSYPEKYESDPEGLLDEISILCGCDLNMQTKRNLSNIAFFLACIDEGLDVISAWHDDSYGCELSEEAKSFPHYPAQEVDRAEAHLSWWIVKSRGKAIAVCNIETGELILDSGKRYNLLNGEGVLAMAELNKRDEQSKTIEDRSELLQKTMDNQTIVLKLLRESTGNNRVKLPSGIRFTILNKTLHVFLDDVVKNMQEDAVAFEGWVLALKAWLDNEIRFVQIDFKPPEVDIPSKGTPAAGHYNRFLYRLNNMARFFPDWFLIAKSKEKAVADFMDRIHSGKFVLNHSLRERESVIDTEEMERQIESWFAFHDGSELLHERWGLDKDKIFNQLPVGVFDEAINAKNAIFTRGNSAIDLWGVDTNQEMLHIIELKYGKNSKMGVISETLFYTALIYDACIAEKPLFSFGRYRDTEVTSDAEVIMNGGERFKNLYAHILSERYHVLFSDGVEKLIQKGLARLNIQFDKAEYSYKDRCIR
ncbi:MAG TPA: hypothetical protein PKV44_05125 [Bacillota bacterium]|nr:hypothetical protein [Bacillota bacterium]